MALLALRARNAALFLQGFAVAGGRKGVSVGVSSGPVPCESGAGPFHNGNAAGRLAGAISLFGVTSVRGSGEAFVVWASRTTTAASRNMPRGWPKPPQKESGMARSPSSFYALSFRNCRLVGIDFLGAIETEHFLDVRRNGHLQFGIGDEAIILKPE